MDGQGRIVMPIVGATSNRGRPANDNLYNTSYRESYGRADPGMVNFSSHLQKPGHSGFTANNRPAIYYKPRVDYADNPQMVLLLSDSFMSQTKQDYQPRVQPKGSGFLLNLLGRHREGGFHQLRSHPKTAVLEKRTEYQRMYELKSLTKTAHNKIVTVGPKTESGFTRETDRQPRKISMVDPQQTYSSVTRSDFMCPFFLQGNKATLSLPACFGRESGFTRGAITPLACDPTSVLLSPKTKSDSPTKRTIGVKEPTGYLSNAPNNQAFPNTPFDGSHFTTHYRSMFCHHANKDKRTHAGILNAKKDYVYNRPDTVRFILRG